MLQSLGFYQLIVIGEVLKPLLQLVFDLVYDRHHALTRGDVMGFGKDRVPRQLIEDLACQRIKVESSSISSSNNEIRTAFFRFRRKHVNDVATHTVGAALKRHVITGVLQFCEALQNRPLINRSPRST